MVEKKSGHPKIKGRTRRKRYETKNKKERQREV
jgi:hypothetical protein